MKTRLRNIILITSMLVYIVPDLISQENCLDEDYGKFCLSFPWSKEITLFLYHHPDSNTVPFANYHIYDEQTGPNSYVTGVSKIQNLTTNEVSEGKAVFELMVGESFGIAGLDYSPDSQWVLISLEYKNIVNPRTAWVNLNQAQEAGISVKLWSEFLMHAGSLYFRCDSAIQFYSQPNSQARFNFQQEEIKMITEGDYSIDPIRIEGEWMYARLYIPSNFIEKDENATKHRATYYVWLRYLDANGRPQLWYMWE